MSPAPITTIYASLLGLLFVALSLRVIRTRGCVGVALGSGADPLLQRAVRVQANFAEYVPLALVLMALVEIAGASVWLRVPVDEGQIHLFGFRLQYRSWSHTTFKLLGRAVLLPASAD